MRLRFIYHNLKIQNIKLNRTNEMMTAAKQIRSTSIKMWSCIDGMTKNGLKLQKTYLQHKIIPYSIIALNTKNIQAHIHAVMLLVNDSMLGEFEVMYMKRLIKFKNEINSRAIRPGIASWGITKLIWK